MLAPGGWGMWTYILFFCFRHVLAILEVIPTLSLKWFLWKLTWVPWFLSFDGFLLVLTDFCGFSGQKTQKNKFQCLLMSFTCHITCREEGTDMVQERGGERSVLSHTSPQIHTHCLPVMQKVTWRVSCFSWFKAVLGFLQKPKLIYLSMVSGKMRMEKCRYIFPSRPFQLF